MREARELVVEEAENQLDTLEPQEETSSSDQKLVSRLVETGHANEVIENLERFEGIDHFKLAIQITHTESAELVINNLKKFTKLDWKEFINFLVGIKMADVVINNLEKLPELNHQEFVNFLIDIDMPNVVIDNLEKFQGIDHQKLAQKLVKKRSVYTVINNLEKFTELNHQKFVNYLVRTNNEHSLILYLEEFQEINYQELATKLIKKEFGEKVLDNLHKFQEIDHQKLVDDLVEAGFADLVADNLEEFQGIDHQKLVDDLVEAELEHWVAHNLEKFQGIDHKWLIDYLIEKDKIDPIIDNLEKFQGIDHQKLATKLIKKEFEEKVLNNLEKFQGIDHQELVDDFVKAGFADLVADNLEEFQGIDHQKLVDDLVEAELEHLVADNLEEFQSIDHQWLINYLIEKDKIDPIVDNLEKFQGIDHQWLMAELIKRNHHLFIILNIDKFEEVIHIDWAELINDESLKNASSREYSSLFKLQYYLRFMPADTQRVVISKLTELSERIQLAPELIEHGTKEVLEKLSLISKKERDKLIILCKTNKYYKALFVLINHFNIKAPKIGFSWQEITQEITSLINENNPNHANDLILCAKALFPKRTREIENIEKTIPKHRDSKQDQEEERVRFEKLDCSNEILKYYLSVILKNKFGQLNLNTKLSSQINDPIESLFEKVKEYMIVAVTSELRHWRETVRIIEPQKKGLILYKIATDEDIRIFFQRSEHISREREGEIFAIINIKRKDPINERPWTTISKFGQEIWKEQVANDLKKKIALLNIVVGIQHNDGYFFDKDKKRVNFSSSELESLFDFEASGNRTLSEFLDYGIKNGIITQEEYDYYLGLEKELVEYRESLKVKLNPGRIYQENFINEVQKRKTLILNNPNIPNEIKIAISTTFDNKSNLSRDQDGFVLLARLMKTMSINWQEDDGVIKKYQNKKETFYYTSIGGYDLAFWYKDGSLQIIDNKDDLKNLIPKLSKIFNQQIVKAQVGYLTEGD